MRRGRRNIISMSLSGPPPSQTEQEDFHALAAKGVLSIAASSNAGTTSVVSVGALDVNKQWAAFSNFSPKVELSAPGVAVLSTVPLGFATRSELRIGAVNYVPGAMTGSPRAVGSAPLANFGLGGATDPAVAGKVCLIQRGGGIAFGVKVANCQASGGVGAVVFNSAGGASFTGTLGTTVTAIPSVTASAAEGAAMLAQLGQNASVTVRAYNYDAFNGTSMATPHLAAVAALVRSYFPMCSAAQIRSTLGKSAQDLGPVGRDVKYGHGLVQARAAYDRLHTYGCKN
ncbi:MAG: S8 family serine peptidase [Pseudomonadota bacterium]